MQILKVQASRRGDAGKGPAARLRREGKIPAVAYGRALPSVPLAVAPKVLHDILRSEMGQNTVVEIEIEGGRTITAMLREYAYHPVTRELLHADFLEIRLDAAVDVEVPLQLVGKAAGVVEGGILRHIHRRLPVRCLPDRIPKFIEHDVSALTIGGTVKVRELVLPEGIQCRLGPDESVAGVVAPEKEIVEEAAAVAGVPGEPGAVPAEGAAPGAPGAAPGAPGAAPGAPAAPAAPAKEEKPGREERKKRG